MNSGSDPRPLLTERDGVSVADGCYTRAQLERSIALVRAQAPRLRAYSQATFMRGQWMTQTVYMNDDGTDSRFEDGTLVSPGGLVYTSEAAAIGQALQSNVNRVDELLYRGHFTIDRRRCSRIGRRKKAHPFEKSPTLAQVRALQPTPADFHASAGYQRFAECFTD
jgi:hypothetical protein